MTNETVTGRRVRLTMIATEEGVSAHERFARAVRYQQDVSGDDYRTALRKVAAELPDLHREYLDSAPPVESEYTHAFVHGVPISA